MVVVGNPANTNAYIAKMYAEGIPAENFTCLTRLDQNRAQAQVSFLQSFPDCRIRAKIYGNCSVLHCVHSRAICELCRFRFSVFSVCFRCIVLVLFALLSVA